MANKKGSKEGKLVRYMKAPIRLLSKARDFYVQGLSDCSNQLAYVDPFVGCPAVSTPAGLPRSFSVGSATSSSSSAGADDYRELVRAASVGSGRTTLSSSHKKRNPVPAPAKPTKVSRSRSVGIGRIDEEKACEFFKDEIKTKRSTTTTTCVYYGRSKSYAYRPLLEDQD